MFYVKYFTESKCLVKACCMSRLDKSNVFCLITIILLYNKAIILLHSTLYDPRAKIVTFYLRI